MRAAKWASAVTTVMAPAVLPGLPYSPACRPAARRDCKSGSWAKQYGRPGRARVVQDLPSMHVAVHVFADSSWPNSSEHFTTIYDHLRPFRDTRHRTGRCAGTACRGLGGIRVPPGSAARERPGMSPA